MAEYNSRYTELTFYVNGQPRKFQDGRYVTDDKKEIEVLGGLLDAKRVDEPKKEPVKDEGKAEEPVKKAPSKRKKSSAK